MKAIVNARINPVIDEPFEGKVTFDNGVISDIGAEVDIPPDAEIVDARGAVVVPGLVEPHCHTGIHGEAEGPAGNDVNESHDAVTPHLRALDGINPLDVGMQDAVRAGITTVNVGPGSANPIGGQFAALKTAGSPVVDERIILQSTGMKMATGENPKRVYGNQDKTPSVRPATAALLRETLYEAREYLEEIERKGPDDIDRDFKKEALRPVMEGKIPPRIHAHRADDIVTAVRICEEFGLCPVIEHCTEGHKVADLLAEKDIPVILGPFMSSRSKRELRERTFRTAGVLSEVGVEVALMTDSPVIPVQYLPLMAAFAVREGMDPDEALRAITINPARICGIDQRVGSLEVGKDADLVILEGQPLDPRSRVQHVFVSGEEIPVHTPPREGEMRTY
ncbi:MAG: amidohydrolase [Planctomycetota bacterium]